VLVGPLALVTIVTQDHAEVGVPEQALHPDAVILFSPRIQNRVQRWDTVEQRGQPAYSRAEEERVLHVVGVDAGVSGFGEPPAEPFGVIRRLRWEQRVGVVVDDGYCGEVHGC
jgi:hypothetical protein